MRKRILLFAAALPLILAAAPGQANPPGVPPDAKPISVDEGTPVKIDLGTPPPHGWWVKVWGSYKIGDTDFYATGKATDGVNDPATGCVFLTLPDGGQCYYPAELVAKYGREYLKSAHGSAPVMLTIQPLAGAHGTLYYRVDFAS